MRTARNPFVDPGDDRPEAAALLASVKSSLPELERLLERVSGEWAYEDAFYRFYHLSFKAYHVQSLTEEIVEALRALMPGRPLNSDFTDIVRSGTGKRFEASHNQRWSEEVRPLLEAFTHARFFLEMVVKYGRGLERPPAVLPTGWAGVLYLYDLR